MVAEGTNPAPHHLCFYCVITIDYDFVNSISGRESCIAPLKCNQTKNKSRYIFSNWADSPSVNSENSFSRARFDRAPPFWFRKLKSRSTVKVAYCAEQFENDGSPNSTIIKSVKRAMTGEYSRELSVKVFAGQCRLIELGFRQGGTRCISGATFSRRVWKHTQS